METILSQQSLSSIKTLTKPNPDEIPEWITDLCKYWLQVISHFSKDGVVYKFYKSKISGLLNIICPAYLAGVKNWIYKPGSKPEIKWKILKSQIEGILKLIKILNSSGSLIYTRSIKELESLLADLTNPLFFTPEGAVRLE